MGLREGGGGDAEREREMSGDEPEGVSGGVESRTESPGGSPESSIRRRESTQVGGLCSSSESVTHQVPGRSDRV